MSLGHDLGDDGQGDLARSLAAEVVARRYVQLVQPGHALSTEVGEQALGSPAAGHHRDVPRRARDGVAEQVVCLGRVVVADDNSVALGGRVRGQAFARRPLGVVVAQDDEDCGETRLTVALAERDGTP